MQGQRTSTWWRVATTLAAGILMIGCPGEKPGVKEAESPEEGKEAEKEAGRVETAAAPAKADVAAFGVPGASVYISAKPAAILGSGAVKQIIEGVKAMGLVPVEASPEGLVEQQTGLDVDQISQVNVSLFLSEKERKFVLATLFKTPYDRDVLSKKIVEQGRGELKKFDSHEGVDLLRPEKTEEDMALVFVSPTVLALGVPDAIRSSIDNMKAGRAAEVPPAVKKLLESAPADASLVAAATSLAELAKLDPRFAAAGDVSQVKSFAIALTTGETVGLWACANAVDADTAAKLRAQNQAAIDQFKSQPNPMLEAPEMAPLKDAIDSVKVGGQGVAVEVTVTVKPDIVQTLPAIIGMVVGRMQGGAPPAPGAGGDFDFDEDFD